MRGCAAAYYPRFRPYLFFGCSPSSSERKRWLATTLDEIRKHGRVLTPGRCVGAEAQQEEGEPFEEKMKRLVTQLHEQQGEIAKLDQAIRENLKRLGFAS